jgi:3-methyladenine DNA glycosylase AlkD
MSASAGKTPPARPDADVQDVLKALERAGSPKFLADLGPRYGIIVTKAWGVPMAKIKAIAKPLGRNHEMARKLWATGWYEARLLASMVGDPAVQTAAEMDRWCKDLDNWAVVDTLCFNLWDRSPHAFAKVKTWAGRKPEFERRAAFALLASYALHRRGTDAEYLESLELIEASAGDERNFVKKGVAWALRGVGRRVPAPALTLARKLATSEDSTERWIGKDALKDFAKR